MHTTDAIFLRDFCPLWLRGLRPCHEPIRLHCPTGLVRDAAREPVEPSRQRHSGLVLRLVSIPAHRVTCQLSVLTQRNDCCETGLSRSRSRPCPDRAQQTFPWQRHTASLPLFYFLCNEHNPCQLAGQHADTDQPLISGLGCTNF